MRTRLTSLAIPFVLLAACSEQPTSPGGPLAGPVAGGPVAERRGEGGVVVRWNALADQLTTTRTINPATRMFAYLSLAQFRAAEATSGANNVGASTAGAVGGASTEVLKNFFPLDAAAIEAALAADGETITAFPAAEDFAQGVAIGRAIGARVNAYALGDNLGQTDPGTPPVGPGYWLANGPPVRLFLGVRPFYLASQSEIRRGPPPAFGSPEYQAALAEVRHISDTRTAEQLAIGQYWNVNQSPFRQIAPNTIARDLITSYHRSELEAARTLFLVHSAIFDALIGCWDAKYYYWFIRPPQADPAITTPLGLPNHPSYPSGHACDSGAWATVLGAAFPAERQRLADLAEQAGLSRIYIGIHYRFDTDSGLALGRAAAAKALAADLATVAPLP